MKPLLFDKVSAWLRKSEPTNLSDISMGFYDSTGLCDLVILFVIKTKFSNYSIGWFWDDGLSVSYNCDGHTPDTITENFMIVFNSLVITIVVAF